MSMLGRKPARAPLSGADIADGTITSAKIVDGTVAEGDLAFSTATQAELDAQRTNSSITTLGTVTAGNLSNTNIVYPAGHVVNQWGVHFGTAPGSPSFSPSVTPAAIDYGSSNGGKVEVTGITATQGNMLCIFATPGDIHTTNTGTYAIGTGFKIDGTNYINSSIQNANVHTYGIKFPLSLSFRHTVPSGFTNKTISAIAQKQSGGGTLKIVATATNGAYYVSMTIFEIQQ
jgi:hypothetical protein